MLELDWLELLLDELDELLEELLPLEELLLSLLLLLFSSMSFNWLSTSILLGLTASSVNIFSP